MKASGFRDEASVLGDIVKDAVRVFEKPSSDAGRPLGIRLVGGGDRREAVAQAILTTPYFQEKPVEITFAEADIPGQGKGVYSINLDYFFRGY